MLCHDILNQHVYLVETCHANFEEKIDSLDYNHLLLKDASIIRVASLNNNLDVFKYIIETLHFNPKEREGYEKTALHISCFQGNFSIVKYLLENCGLNVEDKNHNGNTPLFYASISGHFQIIKYLIEKFNANVTDSIIDNINKNSSCFDPTPKEEIKSYLLKHKK